MGTKNESDILDTEIVQDTTMSKSSTIIAFPHRTYIKLCYKHIWLTVTHPEKTEFNSRHNKSSSMLTLYTLLI